DNDSGGGRSAPRCARPEERHGERVIGIAAPRAQREAEEKPDLTPSPPPPAESPPPGQDLDPERVNKFVQEYLRDAESTDVPKQVNYYAFPVRYFDHGNVSQEFVTKDTSNYVKRWLERKYTLTGT